LEDGSLILCGTAEALCLTLRAESALLLGFPLPTCGPVSGRIVHRIAVGPVDFVTYVVFVHATDAGMKFLLGSCRSIRQVPETGGWR
jgi:hypothetical protein